MEIGIELLNASKAEIRGVDEVAPVAPSKGKPLVDGSGPNSRAIHGEDSIGRLDVGIPARDRAIFGGKDE